MANSQISSSLLFRAPLTILLGLTSVVVMTLPGLASHWELNIDATTSGQWWRVLTGHLTHWSVDHVVWDLGVLVALGWICESRWRKLSWLTMAASAIAISLSCIIWQGVASYRGLSGIDTAIFAMLGISLLVERWRDRDLGGTMLFAGILVAMLGKIVFEFATGRCLFVDPSTSGFVAVPLAHLVGAAIGLVIGITGHPPRICVNQRDRRAFQLGPQMTQIHTARPSAATKVAFRSAKVAPLSRSERRQ